MSLFEILDAIHSLSVEDRETVLSYAYSLRPPKAEKSVSTRVDEHGVSLSRRMTLADRKSIIYLSKFAAPPAKPGELASVFGVSQQRVSQILGARGHSDNDAALLREFNGTDPSTLRDMWRCVADLERLVDFRAGKIAAAPLSPRNMVSTADPLGRWSAYGFSFRVYERDELFYFYIDGLSDDDSNPRNSAAQALADCIAVVRDEAQLNHHQDSWRQTYGEDYFGAAKADNATRVGE